MKLGSITPPKGSTRGKKRLGAGHGSGWGKTCGKGHKGQKSRSGGRIRPGFEGGQTPLQQRLSKLGGFRNPFRVEYQVVNLDDLARKELSAEITPEILKEAGLIRSANRPVKILGRGEITGALRVHAHAVSASASEKISQAGGNVEILSNSTPETD